MLNYLNQLLAGISADPVELVFLVLALVMAGVLLYQNRSRLRLTDGKNEVDGVYGLVGGAVLGALTGVLWAYLNPIQLAPGIHLRLFAMLPCIFGIVFGRGTGFVSGYVATIVWGVLSNLFLPFHTPLVDGVFVGLTGWIPAMLLRGNDNNETLLNTILQNPRQWYIRAGLVSLFAGLFMSVFVGISLNATIQLPFWTGFGLIGIVSDTPMMVLFTGVGALWLLKATRRQWKVMHAF
ncbi:hypothetical protein M1116_02640 [Patescibacteria group bacterium]|nr:hypothetical protein [Patescibacteria group bacterium]